MNVQPLAGVRFVLADLVAHLGGALGGATCGAILSDAQSRGWLSRRSWLAIEVGLVAIIAISFGLVVSRPPLR